VEVVGRLVHQGLEAGDGTAAQAKLVAHQREGDVSRNQTAHYQHHHLHHVGVAHHLHAANGNEDGEEGQQPMMR
jgi:hypothetical protein